MAKATPGFKSKSLFHGYLPNGAVVMVRARESRATQHQLASAETTPDSLEKVSTDAASGPVCATCKTRISAPVGQGNPKADIFFIGEDLFTGGDGQLLEKMIEAMGLKREQVYIAQAPKCRSSGDVTCASFLFRQIDVVQPKVIVPLGQRASEALLSRDVAIAEIRGKFADFRGIPLLPTFHPSHLVRNPLAKKEVWEDLQNVAKRIGWKIPKRATGEGAKA